MALALVIPRDIVGEQYRCEDSELLAILGSVLARMGCLLFAAIMEPELQL
jgi:hypothetical protein